MTLNARAAITSTLILHGHDTDGRCINIERELDPLSPTASLASVADAVLRDVQKLTDIEVEGVWLQLDLTIGGGE